MTNKWSSVLRLSLLLLLTPPLSSEVTFAQSQQKVHVVKAGETMYRIGKDYGVSVEELLKLNPTARDGIRPGQEIKIPMAPAEPSYHAVQRGETLYSIARQYGVSVDQIMRANPQIKSETELATGIVLKIPAGGTIASAEAPVASTQPTNTPPPLSPQDGFVGLKAVTVPAGATIYSLVRSTGWTEEEFFTYNPQARGGLKAGSTILIPDVTLSNNKAYSDASRIRTTLVLALPFDSESGSRRFADYYSGVLVALLEAKQSGHNIDLHTLDCSDSQLQKSIAYINQLERVDYILGGVSEESVLQLGAAAANKGAAYIIPFTSREYPELQRRDNKIYQINTPHVILYRVASDKFAQEYRDHHVLLVRHPSDSGDKEGFINILKGRLSSSGISYSEVGSHELSTPAQVQAISMRYPRTVVVPTSASKVVANNTLTPIAHAVDSLAVTNVTAFGYPEWQTYMGSLGKVFRTTEATFYTTFFADPGTAAYKSFQTDFRNWYGRGVGNTYPKYSILGYDTMRYFINHLDEHLSGESKGIQSSFRFEPSRNNPSYFTNEGIFFVRFQRGRDQLQS
ncbi:MAG: LysM peptidoglycan-binding domain-containing protein [Porphyromonas sp.]|nr:LysM peptidoglycan-binding domain-containing protein [Porphyromonas sp.]